MKILINGKEAVLKKGFSFDYTAENRLFFGRDGYTLTLTFPMEGCTQNQSIFGNICRLDANKDKLIYECAIIDSHLSLVGSLLIVSISDTEIGGQFAEGRCEQTLQDPLSDKFINQLALGVKSGTANLTTPESAWADIDSGAEAVALPWININYPDAPNNWVEFADDAYSWHPDVSSLSYQPYLIVITKKICNAIGYTYDFSAWENSPYRYLIICNTLPSTWIEASQFNAHMPAWTVSEFFEKLELFLMCEFEFDHKARTVVMQFSKTIAERTRAVKIDTLVDSYSADVEAEDKKNCDYIANKRLAYKKCDHLMANYYACDWYLRGAPYIKRYGTLAELIEKNKRVDHALAGTLRVTWGEPFADGVRINTVNCVLYAADVDTYFVFRSIGTELLREAAEGTRPSYTQLYVLQPINVFGSGYVEDEDSNTEEIEFVPACIADTFISEDDDKGYMMYLAPGNNSSDYSDSENPDTASDPSIPQNPRPAAALIAGEPESRTSAYYDEIYVGFWKSSFLEKGKTPHPVIDIALLSTSKCKIKKYF